MKTHIRTYTIHMSVGLLIHITADIISEVLSIEISPETITKGDFSPHSFRVY